MSAQPTNQRGMDMNRFNLIFLSNVLVTLVAITATLAVVSQPSEAAVMSPFGGELVDLTEHDLVLLKDSVRKVLEGNVVGSHATWSNAETSHFGIVALVKVYERQGLRCGAVAYAVAAGGRTRFVLPFCKHSDGAWKIMF
jgi:surface antigen